MHNITVTLSVSTDIGFKINGQHADVCQYVSLIKHPSRRHVSHVPCGQTSCLLTLSLMKQVKFALVVGFVLIVSGRAASSVK